MTPDKNRPSGGESSTRRNSKTRAGHAGPPRRASVKSRPTLGLLLRTVSDEFSAPFWAGADAAARENDANLIGFAGGMLRSPQGFEAQGNFLYDLVGAENVDGLVIWTGILGHYVGPQAMQKFCARYHPLPMVSIELPLASIPSLLIDSQQGIRQVLAHLIEAHGYRRIAFIRGPEDSLPGEERYSAYRETLAEYDIPFDPNLVAPGTFFAPSGQAAVRLLLDERKVDFDAILAANDNMALDALQALQARGLHVPRDVAVAGFDDVEQARAVAPPLTTARLPFYSLGRLGVEMLLARLRGKEMPEQESVPLELVVRQSCGCPSPLVFQAAADRSGSLTQTRPSASAPEPAPGASLKTEISARRKEILADMEQAALVSKASLRRKWAGRLLDAFAAELAGDTPDAFLPVLDEILTSVLGAGGDVTECQNIISALRRHTLPHLNHLDVLHRAEDLWGQARVAIGEMAHRAQVYRGLQIEGKAGHLRAVSQALITTFDVAQLMNVLTRELPGLNIHSSYLSIYDQPGTPGRWSRLILGFSDQRRIGKENAGRRFPTCQLVPAGVLPRDSRFTLIAHSLHFREEQLGFALFEAKPGEEAVCDALNEVISSALKGALLVQQVESRALQLQTAAEVSRAASAILDPGQLLQQVVDLVRERFALYYVGLFLVDQTGEWTGEPGKWAVLRAGTGEAGQLMLAIGHKLKSGGDSMIGWCVANRQARIALDVGEEAVRFENPYLPATRSEMALPLIARGRVIGAMTVQSEEPSAFSDENITTLQTMADQVAISIENARLFGEQQQASLLLQERIKELNCLNDIGRKVDEAPPVYAFLEWVVQRIPPATRYPDVCTAAIEFEGRVYGAPEAMGLPCQMVQSLRVGGEVVGRVYMAYQEERPFTDGDSALLGGIARRISGYIENRRLFDQTQTALAEVEAVHHSYLQRRWEDYLYHQDLLRDNGFLYDQAIAEGIADARHDAERAAITLEPNLWRPEISRAIAEGQIVTTEGNGSGEERTALAVPIVLRGQTIGVLGIEDPDGRRRWTEEEAALVEAVSRQLALALENARLLEETQRRAARERVNREITDRLRRASDMDHLLQTVVREMSMALGASSAFVQLTAPATRDQNGQDEAGARPQVE